MAPETIPVNPEFPPVPITGTTELRIHGVSGTPVEQMLHHPHPLKVAGSGDAGCFRRGDDLPVPFDEIPPGRNLEAYSWGGLTSGSASRAFWLLLVPFTLANVASWAHPVRPYPKFAPIGVMSGLIRLFALSLTVTFVLATSSVGVDLIAWQCVNARDDCGRAHFFSDFMADHMFSRPGLRIAFGALLPLVVLGVFVWLSKSTGAAYEEYEEYEDVDRDAPTDPDPSGADDLSKPNFWAGGKPFQRLRSLHVATALATLAGIVAYAARDSEPFAWTAAVFAALCGAAVSSSWCGRRRALLEGKEPPRPACIALRNAQWGGLALLVVALVYAGTTPEAAAPSAPSELPGLNSLITAFFWFQLAVLTAYLLATLWAKLRSPVTDRQTLVGRTLFRSFTAPVLATFALGFAGAYASGLVFRVADYLGHPCESGCGPGTVVVGGTYYVAAPAAVAGVFSAGAVWIATKLWLARRRKACAATVAREYAQPAGSSRVRAIARAQASASLTDRADALVTGYLLLTIALTLLFRELDLMTTAGTWLVGVIAIALVVVGRKAYASDASRRTVGIVWDLGTFWPRATHPFAPPCYCERVVPELTRRVRRLAAHGKVVVSAHSQGTVIAAAVLHQLRRTGAGRVALVTYGSPLERLYARLFPHFFGLAELETIRRDLGGRWRNLYRRTDPIGGPVFALDAEGWTCGQPGPPVTDPVDVRLRDPEFDPAPGEFLAPAPRAHSDYFHDARFPATVAAVADMIQS